MSAYRGKVTGVRRKKIMVFSPALALSVATVMLVAISFAFDDISRPVSSGSSVYSPLQVAKSVQLLSGGVKPIYPESLRKARVKGEVLVQFVVDTLGLPEMSSLTVIKSSHELFTVAIKPTISSMRFIPAEVGGRKVRQVVQQPFEFDFVS